MDQVGVLGAMSLLHAVFADEVYFLHMKRIYILLGGIVIIIIGIVVLMLQKNAPLVPTGSTTTSTNPLGLPAGSVSVPATNPNESSGMLNLVLQDGTTVPVPDFTKVDQSPTANAESGYRIAGSNTGDFQILYYPQNSGILISLLSEPLGPVRLAAENALRVTLGLSDSQLCGLTIDVRTTLSISATYSGRDLGLSFCPGATPLPQ